jgi:hypothetical protein
VARRARRKTPSKIATERRRRKNKRNIQTKHERKPDPIIKSRRRGVSDARLECGLRVLSETKDITIAARAIHVSTDRFKLAAKRKAAIRNRNGFWTVVRRLRRKMPIFSGCKQLAITVNSKSASLIGRYMSAVRQFLSTNDPKFLAEFKGQSVKDVRGKIYKFETDPNVLYRLSSAGGEPFEEMYRIVL